MGLDVRLGVGVGVAIENLFVPMKSQKIQRLFDVYTGLPYIHTEDVAGWRDLSNGNFTDDLESYLLHSGGLQLMGTANGEPTEGCHIGVVVQLSSYMDRVQHVEPTFFDPDDIIYAMGSPNLIAFLSKFPGNLRPGAVAFIDSSY